MGPLLHDIPASATPEALVDALHDAPGVILLRSALFDSQQARYSFVAARPFLTFRSFGSRCELFHQRPRDQGTNRPIDQSLSPSFGNPWHVLDALMSRYELLEQMDLPFPLGGCFGYWGYDLKNFVEPRLPRRAMNDLELPDCQVGFYDSLVAFDHELSKIWIISTGLNADGSRCQRRAQASADFWRQRLQQGAITPSLYHLAAPKPGDGG